MKFTAMLLTALWGCANVSDAHDPHIHRLIKEHSEKMREFVETVGGEHQVAALSVGALAKHISLVGAAGGSPPSRALAETASEMRGNNNARILQNSDQAVTCTILSIAVENTKFAGVRPLEDYDESVVCLKEGECDGAPEIKFVSHDAKKNQFLYLDNGPMSMQGVFWLNYQDDDASDSGYCSSIYTFAESKDGYPLSTGELRSPTFPFPSFYPAVPDLPDVVIPNTNTTIPNSGVPGYPVAPSLGLYSGAHFDIRTAGDSVWGFSGTDECFADTDLDLIYGYKLLEGTLEEPKKFLIVPSFKLSPQSNLRASIDDQCLEQEYNGTYYADFTSLRFEQTLVEDCSSINANTNAGGLGNDAYAYAACEAGAVVWLRQSWANTLRSGPPNTYYYMIQIVDGCGEKIQPSYDAWVDDQSNTPQPYVVAFRTLKTAKRAKNSTCRERIPKKGKTAKAGKSLKRG